jgi:hypothetical protein
VTMKCAFLLQEKQSTTADLRTAGRSAAATAAEADLEECHVRLSQLLTMNAKHVTERDQLFCAAAMSAAAAERADQEARLVDDAKMLLQVRFGPACMLISRFLAAET